VSMSLLPGALAADDDDDGFLSLNPFTLETYRAAASSSVRIRPLISRVETRQARRPRRNLVATLGDVRTRAPRSPRTPNATRGNQGHTP
jgi:hypothetical protein